MRRILLIFSLFGLLTACTGGATGPPATLAVTPTVSVPSRPPPSTIPTAAASPEPSPTPTPGGDVFSQMGISLPAPTCSGLTQSQSEGPYYRPDSPQRHSLLEVSMPGTRLILAGYVLDESCQPLADAWLDFWQADAGGEYDNSGYRLRGHQFTDAQGRYYLETILPGQYASRPIEHIHVKVHPPGGQEITTQLYFPGQPVDGLTVTLEDRGDHQVGYFNFVVKR